MKIRRKGWMGEWDEEVPDEIRAEVLGDGSIVDPDPNRYLPKPEKVKETLVEQRKRAGRLGGRPRGSTKLQMVWDQAIIALLTYPSENQAAEAIGVPRRTLRDWLKNPLFLEQLDIVHRQRTAHAVLALQGNMGKIIESLLDIAYDKAKSDTSRIAAMKLMLDKISEIQDRDRAESEARSRVDRLEKVKDEIIAGRLGGEDPALPEAGETGETGIANPCELERQPELAVDPVSEDDGSASDRVREAGSVRSTAGPSNTDE